MYIEDLSRRTYCFFVHDDRPAFSVGWLGNFVPTKGDVPSAAMMVLRHYAEHCTFEDGFLGKHGCEICDQVAFKNEFWIEFFDEQSKCDVRFVLPTGVFHYIEAHGYCPPQEFLDAIAPLAEELLRREANDGGIDPLSA